MSLKLLGINGDAKTVKGTKYGFLTGILYLAPAKISGHEVCPSRSEGCTAGCLFTAGRGAYSSVQSARIRKTQLLFNNRFEFLKILDDDIRLLKIKADKQGLKPCVRLNGTSDLGWEGFAKELMEKYPDVQFYDYTKVPSRMLRYLDGKFPANYHLTFSKSESNDDDVAMVLHNGGNVAVVFKNKPEKYNGYTVVDGDQSDLRFLDGANVIVGLKAKGKARRDTSGFVVTV
jgi:hypothetical protein